MAEKSPLVSKAKLQRYTANEWRKGWFLELVCLFFTTFVLIAAFIINGFAGAGDPSKFGFSNTTGNISDQYYTEVTPSGWTFSIWGLIYFCQALWILYGWTIVFRPRATRTILNVVYLIFAFTNICNIIWVYLWGNDYIQAAFPFLFLVSTSLWCSIGIAAYYLNRIATDPLPVRLMEFKVDYYITQVIVINGLAIYATWTTIATLINFSAVLEYYGDFNGVDVGTVALSLLTIELAVYFLLENIFLDRFLRFVFIVYPVVIWALSGVISGHGTDERNGIFTVVLLSLAGVLLIMRCVLWVIFAFFCRIKSTQLFRYKHIV